MSPTKYEICLVRVWSWRPRPADQSCLKLVLVWMHSLDMGLKGSRYLDRKFEKNLHTLIPTKYELVWIRGLLISRCSKDPHLLASFNKIRILTESDTIFILACLTETCQVYQTCHSPLIPELILHRSEDINMASCR